MARGSRARIVVAGAGIAGSLIASGLADLDGVELICLERTPRDGQLDAGTGLNLGPNAVKALRAVMPGRAEAIVEAALPWQRWSVALTDDTMLMDLALADVADCDGIRIRWAELYALLRAPVLPLIRFGREVCACRNGPAGLVLTVRDIASGREEVGGINLLVAADGRYSAVRTSFLPPEEPSFLGVCLYRVLFEAGRRCPIDDYAQWFNGSNRLLAFRVPGGFVYLAGSFPISTGEAVSADRKAPDALRRLYTPQTAEPSGAVTFLLDRLEQNAARIHWARLQDGTVRFSGPPGVLLVGDAAHPMVPTLGQGATQSVEDACVVVDAVRCALRAGQPIRDVAAAVEHRRRERVEFVVRFSREATDTMLEGADPVAGTRRKMEPPFLSRLERLYRDTPEPLARQ